MDARRWISVAACAEALGLHPMSVRKMIARGTIPAAKVGGAVRIDFKAVEKNLEDQASFNSRIR